TFFFPVRPNVPSDDDDPAAPRMIRWSVEAVVVVVVDTVCFLPVPTRMLLPRTLPLPTTIPRPLLSQRRAVDGTGNSFSPLSPNVGSGKPLESYAAIAICPPFASVAPKTT